MDLGQKLLEEIKLESGVDTLGRWMIHYIAEVMMRAKNAKGIERADLERECFDVILQLWKHRSASPGKPLQSFEPIFKMLNTLGDPYRNWYFFGKSEEVHGEVGKWIEIATHVDSAALGIVRWCIGMASLHASVRERKWLKTRGALEIDQTEDIRATLQLLENAKQLVGNDKKWAERRENEVKVLRQRIDGLLKIGRVLRDQLNTVLGSKKNSKRNLPIIDKSKDSFGSGYLAEE